MEQNFLPSSSNIWSVELSTGQTNRKTNITELLCRLRLNEGREYISPHGTLYWHLSSASFELRADKCHFIDGAFAFDVVRDYPLNVNKIYDKKTSSNASSALGALIKAEGFNPPQANLSADASAKADHKADTEEKITISYTVRASVNLVSNNPPRFELGIASDNIVDLLEKISVRLNGLFIGSQDGLQPIAKFRFSSEKFEIVPLLIFRREDVQISLSKSTGIFTSIFDLLRKKSAAKRKLVNILLHKSCYPSGYQAEVAIAGPTLTFSESDA